MTKKQKKQLQQYLYPLVIALVAFLYATFQDKLLLPELTTPTSELTNTISTGPSHQEVATAASTPADEQTETASSDRETAVVKRVVDGDTIVLEDDRRVRYIGIDTPETVHPSKPQGCYGSQASDKNKELVSGRRVELEKDVSDTDRYGRLLRYVYVDGQMVNEILVAGGYATAATYPPDVKYQDRFRELETQARAEKLGIWSDECAGAQE